MINKFKQSFASEQSVDGRRRLYNSLWALLFGIIVSVLIIAFTGNNPFEVFQFIYNEAVSNSQFVVTIAVFIVATIGTALCFKSGIFNIGVSGQMMAGGMTSILILKLIGINGGTIVFAIITAMLSGLLVALAAGVLKAFLNVNEVVSTILLNWTVFFIIKFIINLNIPGLVTPISISQNRTDPFSMPDFFESGGWFTILIIFSLILIISTWFLFTKTSIGYKMKMLALNKDASKYAGSNEKVILLSIMAVSGALSGLAGFLFYTSEGTIQASVEPMTLGFDTIAITLLVYNNPFGIGISSTLFAVIRLGSVHLKGPYDPLTGDFAQIMFGIIIYIAAIAIVFEKLRFYTYIKNQYIYYYKYYYLYYNDSNYKEILALFKTQRKNIASTKKANNQVIKEIKSEYKDKWKEIKKQSISQKEEMDRELLFKKKIIDLPSETQQYYFNQISEIKKNKDIALFNNRYFEITAIKNLTKSAKLENKNMLIDKKKELLEIYLLERRELKLIKHNSEAYSLYQKKLNEYKLAIKEIISKRESSLLDNNNILKEKIIALSGESNLGKFGKNTLKSMQENPDANSKYEEVLSQHKIQEAEIYNIEKQSRIQNDDMFKHTRKEIIMQFNLEENEFSLESEKINGNF
ncbi:MAG: ABC transporter permease subunit [Metamycoplasmataceae bacterium]